MIDRVALARSPQLHIPDNWLSANVKLVWSAERGQKPAKQSREGFSSSTARTQLGFILKIPARTLAEQQL